jgi:hypothetical protein
MISPEPNRMKDPEFRRMYWIAIGLDEGMKFPEAINQAERAKQFVTEGISKHATG